MDEYSVKEARTASATLEAVVGNVPLAVEP